VYGGPWVDFAAMAVRRGIPALELPRNCSGFSEANGTFESSLCSGTGSGCRLEGGLNRRIIIITLKT
jgi:hypothetical protein